MNDAGGFLVTGVAARGGHIMLEFPIAFFVYLGVGLLMNATEVRATWSMAGLFALRMLGLFMVLPVFAIYGKGLTGSTPELIGVAIGAYGLSQAFLQIPFGLLSDRIGRKPVIFLGLVVFCIGSIVAATSTSIYGVIFGRLLQGGGAIASAVMALLSDLTRDENRTKAMAMVGASIGMSFSLALIMGPVIAGYFNLSGVFWLTAVLAILGIVVTYSVVPDPEKRLVRRDARPVVGLFTEVFKVGELMRLNLGVFVLHLSMTASFVVLPTILLNNIDLDKSRHWEIYLPVLFVSFVLMLPAMIYAEKQRKVKQVFLLAIGMLGVALLMLGYWHNSIFHVLAGLFIYFWGFNLLEAMLPSLVSKVSSPALKGTSMGVYSTCQFLGAAAGGAGGGWLLGHYGNSTLYYGAAVAVGVWLLVAAGMKQPRHLQSMTLQLQAIDDAIKENLTERLLAVAGVEEAVVIPQDGAAYLKVDNRHLDKEQLQALASASK